MKWLERLRNGLDKTSATISKAFNLAKLDAVSLNDIEEALLTADIGSECTSEIIAKLSKHKFDKENLSMQVRKWVAEYIAAQLSLVSGNLTINSRPHIALLCGINGNGKTTTAGKLAAHYKDQGKEVMLVACDTFRAAAVEQLEEWAKRVNCSIITAEHGADPASVAYKAVIAAKEQNIDLVLIDTAGRLHNKTNLMQEFDKIVRVIKKADYQAPHDVIMVIDATTGQNAIGQVETFSKLTDITGIIVTKLDGSAKGGILVSIANKFSIPIIAVGVGEAIDDLQPFDPVSFANTLMGF
jgi:fused signal recognition particle receptor